MTKSISERRHHKVRLKNKRKNDNIYCREFPINKHVITPKNCSCINCGNNRKYFGNGKQAKTVQELRADES